MAADCLPGPGRKRWRSIVNKPASFRAALVEALGPRHAATSTDPDKLQIVIMNCSPACNLAPGKSFEIRYELDITLIDFAGEELEVIVPMMIWLQRWQSDLLASEEAAAAGIRITAIPLADKVTDLHIVLKLSERIAFKEREGGGYDIGYAEEPEPFLFEQAEAAPLHSVWLDGEEIFHCAAHPNLGV
ncbi:MAG: phage tail protein [Caulobacteraceae bacterium]|nr:MAG: phage tail protein [Caulobacteraceae bacterium]